MPKLLNTRDSIVANDVFRHRLLDCGLSSVSLFYCELLACDDINGRPCTALARDVHALYKTWCGRLGIRPCAVPRFVSMLQRQHGVTSKRLRYMVDGKQLGPHGVLALNTGGSTLSVQIADFRRFAAKVKDGVLA